MHLGLIGGIGPAATVFYYERIVRAMASADAPLNLTIAHSSANTLSRNVTLGRVDDQAAEFGRLATQLVGAGIEKIAITSMGGHFCIDAFEPLSPVPVIHGPRAVAGALSTLGIQRIGILGTRVVMQTGLYGALKDHDPVAPAGSALDAVNDDYIAVAIAGRATEEQSERLVAAGRRLVVSDGVDAVLLGGTDLNIVYDTPQVDFPVIDSAQCHVDAIVADLLNN